MAIQDFLAAIMGNQGSGAQATPEEILQKAAQGRALADRTLSPSEGVTGAGAVGHVLNALRGNMLQGQSYQAGAQQERGRNAASIGLAPPKYTGEQGGVPVTPVAKKQPTTVQINPLTTPQGGSDLISERTRFTKELEDPNTRHALFALTHAEVGNQGPEAQKAFMETVYNRAAARGKSLADTIYDRNYYPKITHARMNQYNPDNLVKQYSSLHDEVAGGSNISNFATGNASGTVKFNGGPETFKASGERFGQEGPDVKWAQRMALGGPSKKDSVIDIASDGPPIRVAESGNQKSFAPDGQAVLTKPPIEMSPKAFHEFMMNPRTPFEQKLKIIEMLHKNQTPEDIKESNRTIQAIPGNPNAVSLRDKSHLGQKAGDIIVNPKNDGGFRSEITAQTLQPGPDGKPISDRTQSVLDQVAKSEAQTKMAGESTIQASKGTLKEREADLEGGDNAMATLTSIDVMKQLAASKGYKSLFTGNYGTPIGQFANDFQGLFGKNPLYGKDSLAVRDMLNYNNQRLATLQVKKYTNRGTQFDLMKELAANPSLLHSEAGFKTMVDYMEQTAKLDLKLSEAANAHGHSKTSTLEEYQKLKKDIIQKNTPVIKVIDKEGKLVPLDVAANNKYFDTNPLVKRYKEMQAAEDKNKGNSANPAQNTPKYSRDKDGNIVLPNGKILQKVSP